MRVSRSTLKLLAALTWYIGGGVLLYNGTGYLIHAVATGAIVPPILAGLAGVTLGLLRGRTMFLNACRRNLRRIERLDDPRVWQFFRAGFFVALAVMIAAGAVLAWVAGTGYWGEVVVGGLELVIATALLTSSIAFWQSPADGWRGGDRSDVDAPQSPR